MTSDGSFYSFTPDTDYTLYFVEMTFDDGTVWELRSPLGGDGGLTITGQNNDETLFGGGIDTQSGAVFHDYMFGNDGNDALYGYEGNDTLLGGAGRDTLNGGSGDDVYEIRFEDLPTSNGTRQSLVETANGGTDTIRIIGADPADLRISYGNGEYHFSLINGSDVGYFSASASIIGANGGDGVDFASYFEFIEFDDGTIWDLSTGLYAVGLDTAQTLYGSVLSDYADGRGGNDHIFGYGGDDTLLGGAGRDTLNGGSGDDVYEIRFEDLPTSNGTRQSLVETANGGTDTIRIIGADPADLRISYGNGEYQFGLINGSDVGYFSASASIIGANGGDGVDFASYFEFIEFDDSTVWDLSNGLYAVGLDTAQTLHGSVLSDYADGRDGNDHIFGYGGDDTLLGGAGRDTLDGGNGDDTTSYSEETGGTGVTLDLAVGTATDSYGDADQLSGIENVTGSQWNDLISGDAEDNLLIGAEGRDTLLGQDGDDTLDGGNGGDDLEGGRGSDLAFGGNKRDIILGGYDDDTLIGRAGNDLIKGNRGADSLVGGADDDRLWGGAQGDTIDGGVGDDLVKAGDGRDLITMGDGADIFFDTAQGGANGRDTVDGGAGEDTLNSWGGHDLLTGGADADIFAFVLGSDHDTITDFEVGVDMIDLSAWSLAGGFADLKVREVVGGVEVLRNGDPLDQIFLAGLTKADIDAGDFVFV